MEKFIPPLVMICLVIYCLKDVSFISSDSKVDFKGFVPQFSGVLLTILLHLWKNNSLLSIFGGTALFMVLSRVF